MLLTERRKLSLLCLRTINAEIKISPKIKNNTDNARSNKPDPPKAIQKFGCKNICQTKRRLRDKIIIKETIDLEQAIVLVQKDQNFERFLQPQGYKNLVPKSIQHL